MVGGRIWHVTHEDRTRLLLVQGTGCEANQWLCLRVVRGREPLRRGDQVWWQGRKAFWTPEPPGDREDVPLDRVGYAFAPPEDVRQALKERVGEVAQ